MYAYDRSYVHKILLFVLCSSPHLHSSTKNVFFSFWFYGIYLISPFTTEMENRRWFIFQICDENLFCFECFRLKEKNKIYEKAFCISEKSCGNDIWREWDWCNPRIVPKLHIYLLGLTHHTSAMSMKILCIDLYCLISAFVTHFHYPMLETLELLASPQPISDIFEGRRINEF